MDSNLEFLRKFINNCIIRELCLKPLCFLEIAEHIYNKTDKAYYLKENALRILITQLLEDNIINTSDNIDELTACTFMLTESGQKHCDTCTTTWEVSKSMLDRLFKDNYKIYSAEEVDDAMYGRTGIALISDGEAIGIDFYYNDVFAYKPSNSYIQLSIDTERENRKADAMAKLGIGGKKSVNARIKNTDEINKEQNLEDNHKKEVAADEALNVSRKHNLEDYIKMNESEDKDSPYRATLDSMFGSRNDNIVAEATTQGAASELTIATSGYADLKERLLRIGHKLKPYVKQTTTSYYSMNFVFNNKLKRDTYSILYFIMLLQIFIGYFFVDKFINIGFIAYISIAAALLLVPLYGWINYLVNPDKRIRAQFNFKFTVSGALMLYVNLLQITILLGFFVFKADIYTAKTMIAPIFYPAVLLINMPLAVVVYYLLYKTEKYHLK